MFEISNTTLVRGARASFCFTIRVEEDQEGKVTLSFHHTVPLNTHETSQRFIVSR